MVMAIRPILTAPHPVLRKQAKRIKVIDAYIRNLAADMIETMECAKGVGLAAPQIGASLRLCVLHLPEEHPFALVNPEVVKRIGERSVKESCLSIPGYQGRIKRAVEVTVKGLDLDGKPIRFKAKELLAQALEHEIDHLDGVLYIDYITTKNGLYEVEPEEDDELNDEVEAHVS